MYLSVAEVYETVIKGSYPEDAFVMIEEWSVVDIIDFIPSSEFILGGLLLDLRPSNEMIAGGWSESAENAWTVEDSEISDSVNRLRRVLADKLADKVTFGMADQKLRSLTLEINGGHPKIDGEDLYVRTPE